MFRLTPTKIVQDEEKGIANLIYDYERNFPLNKLSVHGPIVIEYQEVEEPDFLQVPIGLKDVSFMEMSWDEETQTLDVRVNPTLMKELPSEQIVLYIRDIEAYDIIAEDGAVIKVSGIFAFDSISLKSGSSIDIPAIFRTSKFKLEVDRSSVHIRGLMGRELSFQLSEGSKIKIDQLSGEYLKLEAFNDSLISMKGLVDEACFCLYNQSIVDASQLSIRTLRYEAYAQSSLDYNAEYTEYIESEQAKTINWNENATKRDPVRIVKRKLFKMVSFEDTCEMLLNLKPCGLTPEAHSIEFTLDFDPKKKLFGNQCIVVKNVTEEDPYEEHLLLISPQNAYLAVISCGDIPEAAKQIKHVLKSLVPDGRNGGGQVLVSVSADDLDCAAIPEVMQVWEVTPEEAYEETKWM